MNKCYVHLERLPKHMIKSSFVKVDMKYEFSSHEALKFDEIKIEEHEDLNDRIYKDDVSHALLFFSKNVHIYILTIVVQC